MPSPRIPEIPERLRKAAEKAVPLARESYARLQKAARTAAPHVRAGLERSREMVVATGMPALAARLYNRIPERFRKGAVAAGVLLFGVLLFNLLVATGPDVAPQQRQEIVNRVETVTVNLTDTRPVYVAFGKVEATRKAELRFTISGEIDHVDPGFRNGAIVNEGDELARLDTELLVIARDEIREQHEAEKLNVKALETELELRQKQFDRVSRMREEAVVSEARLDDSRLALTQATNMLSQARSRRAQLDLRLRRAERDLQEARLTAPFTGVISSVDVGVGKVVGNTVKLALLTDVSSLEVSFVVPSEVYAQSSQLIGDEVGIIWKAGGRDVVSLKGEVTRAEGQVTATEGGGRIYASIQQQGGVPPGAFVEVRVPSLPLKGVATLPDVALFDNDTVYVVKDGRSSARKVRVLARSEGKIFVSGPLAEGDRVIATRIPGLGEGVLVEAVNP